MVRMRFILPYEPFRATCRTIALIIWPNPQAGKMKRILFSDWLPERVRSANLAHSGFPPLVPQEKVPFILTRPQSSLLRKERSARGDGKEERGREKRRLSPFLLPITPRFSPFSRETTGDESAFYKSFIGQHCSVNMDFHFVSVHKYAKKNLASIEPS